MLQFADKPDIAYEMCTVVAPDCRGLGYFAGGIFNSELEPRYRPLHYNEITTQTDFNVETTEQPRTFENVDTERFIDRNQTNNPWEVASRELTTIRPNWHITESYNPITGQFVRSTDAGMYLKNINICYIVLEMYNSANSLELAK